MTRNSISMLLRWKALALAALAFPIFPSACSSATIPAVQTAEGGQQDPSCVEAFPEVRYRNYGYDHVVHLYSRCDVRAYCAVSTDANPNAVEVVVPPREHVEVLTFRGSPAREFTPKVSCRFLV